MLTTYVAFGMELRCSFTLAGMTPTATAELPSLSVRRVSAPEIEEAWSGSNGAPAWRGVLGDGCWLTIERGRSGDLLFAYEDRARFLLDPDKVTLDCTPFETGLHWQQVLLGRILPNVGLERGYEALHASAVDSPEGVLAVAAPSGMGKTTLATELMRRGRPLFADDVLTLSAERDGVCAHPATPLMNVAMDAVSEEGEHELGRTVAVLSGERWIAAANATRASRPVRMICLFERGPNLPLRLRRLPSSPLPLAPYMLGLDGGSERERSRFSLYADLMGATELVKLTCNADHEPGEVADLLERTLRSSTPLIPSPLLAQGA